MDIQQLSNQLNDEFRKIDARFGALEKKHEDAVVANEKRFNNLENKLDARFNAVDARFFNIENVVNVGFAQLNSRCDKIDTRIDKVEHAFDVRVTRVAKIIDDRLVSIERKIGGGVRGNRNQTPRDYSDFATGLDNVGGLVDEIESDA